MGPFGLWKVWLIQVVCLPTPTYFRSLRSSPATFGVECSVRWRCCINARDTGNVTLTTALGPKPPLVDEWA